MTLHPADRTAFEKIAAADPVWSGFSTAADACGVADNVLLHAGPGFTSPRHVTVPILNSACVAAVWEGLAADFDEAEAMITAGELLLKPAQDHGVVTPLAAVVSASMPLHAVEDPAAPGVRTFSPINGGSRPAMRLGQRTQAVLEHIRWLNTHFRDVLENGLGDGVPLVPLAVAGLRNGDDCHGRTPVSTSALVEELKSRTKGGISDGDVLEFMETSPSLFLNLWMAATKYMMKQAGSVAGSTVVTAAGGNGRDVGVQIAGLPGEWFTVPASPPRGRFDVDLPENRALGAIGDSAVVDVFGLGAMAIERSPAQMEYLQPFLPDDASERISRLAGGPHPAFADLDIKLGCTARAAVAYEAGPLVSLGILDREGIAGRLGGGVYDMPVEPLADALKALDR